MSGAQIWSESSPRFTSDSMRGGQSFQRGVLASPLHLSGTRFCRAFKAYWAVQEGLICVEVDLWRAGTCCFLLGAMTSVWHIGLVERRVSVQQPLIIGCSNNYNFAKKLNSIDGVLRLFDFEALCNCDVQRRQLGT